MFTPSTFPPIVQRARAGRLRALIAARLSSSRCSSRSPLLSSLCAAALAIMLAAADPAQAQERENCFHTASVKYQLDPWLLVAIARVESTMQPDAHRRYDDGSEDIGLMQINSVWFPTLARHGIARADLFQHCTSIHVGAWILATQLYRHGKSWHTVGRYHSSHPEKNAAWVARVTSRLRAEHPNFALFNQGLTARAVKVLAPATAPTAAAPASAAPVSVAPVSAAPAAAPVSMAPVSLAPASLAPGNPA